MNVGMVALIVASALILLRTVDESKAIARMPWGVILMVTGVTVLIALLQETEGLALITTGIANLSTPATIEPIVAFGVGHRVGLQQHVRRRAAGVPADGARSRAAARRPRSAADRLVDERRREPRRSLVAVDGRRAVHRGRCGSPTRASCSTSCSPGACRCRSSALCSATSCSPSAAARQRRSCSINQRLRGRPPP